MALPPGVDPNAERDAKILREALQPTPPPSPRGEKRATPASPGPGAASQDRPSATITVGRAKLQSEEPEISVVKL